MGAAGGSLKSPSEADSESLQAAWVADLNELSLRGQDIYTLIQRARWELAGVRWD